MSSLNRSIRSCKVSGNTPDFMHANRLFEPSSMVCPVWNGHDTYGRPVCRDSMATLTAGCTSANVIMDLETANRPDYSRHFTRGECLAAGSGNCPTKPLGAAPAQANATPVGNQTAKYTRTYCH